VTQAASHNFSYPIKKPEASEPKPWKGICSSGCYSAKTDRKKCKCKCRGQHHGKGNMTKPGEEMLTEYCQERMTPEDSD